MSLFGKKTHIRFETITVDRERDVFRALENKGWTLCTDPFQFDVQKSHEKLRKDALKMAKELHAELLVEVWDPIYQHMHWKGLKYSAWRRATREELIEREKAKKLKERPDYSDSLGSYEDIAQRLEKKKIHIDQEDLHQYDNILVAEQTDDKGEVYGSSDEDMGMVTEHFDTVSSLNPYDHQGESQSEISKRSNIDQEAARAGPVFDESHKLELAEEGPQEDATKELDPLAMMMEAAPAQETTPQPAAPPQAPQPVQQAPPPQNVQPAQLPQPVQQAPPPQPVQQPQPPANIPPAPAPMPQAPAPPPALGAPPQPPQALAPAQPPAQPALPGAPVEKKGEEEQGQ